MCLPLWLMVSGSPDASLHWSHLFLSQSGFRQLVVSGSPDVSRSGQWCFPIWPVLSGSLGVSLYVPSFMCLPLWLVAVRMSSLCFAWLPSFVSYHLSLIICLPIHLSPNSFVFNHQPALVVVSDSFVYSCHLSPTSFVSPFICLP